ncbi:hypothetical protein [Agrococcus baldri]|uniref:Lipoprotein n=1 Tax=Agrococcus baldri TaxID=153730 RepID=A0AA87RE63_9MICO|nr:hypothetical protein [Agrococcus baldri]GEK81081.1 hypothetical protein ABA31_24320 [Agrococcus baldri]
MKKTRILALPAIAAASLLALTGCFQLPPVGGNGGTTTTEEPSGGTTSEDIAGTSWTGDFNGQVTGVAFTLNEDGTVDFDDWAGDSFDSPGDVWTQSGDTVELTVTQIRVDETSPETFDVTMSGTAADGTMSLTGEGTDGNTYELTATQG